MIHFPGHVDLDVVLDSDRHGESLLLPLGQQVSASVRGPSGAVEIVVLVAAVTVQVLLDPSRARRTTWKWSMTAAASGSPSVVAVLNRAKPSIGTTSTASRQALGRCASPVLRACFARPSTMSSSRECPVLSDRDEVDDHGYESLDPAGIAWPV